MHRFRPKSMIKPYNHRTFQPQTRIKHWVYEKIKTPADASGEGYLLYDYYQLSDLVKSMPNAHEKIRLVNPYERPWTASEKRWHRPWLPELFEPRQAWAVPPTPLFYDTTNFYKYVAKCRLFTGAQGRTRLDKYYDRAAQPSAELIASFQKRLAESLFCFLTSKEANASLDNILRAIFEDLHTYSLSQTHDVNGLRLSHTARCESFWIRAGFKKFYKEHKVYWDEVEDINEPFIGDDRRRLGQLSFTMRDELVSQTRGIKPIRNLFEWSNTDELYAPVFTESVDLERDVLFDPTVYKLRIDSNILWQCPGYEDDTNDPCAYGALALKKVSNLTNLLNYWKPDSVAEEDEMRQDFYSSTALMSLFNWLNGQAHCTGNTQYNDIERPLTSQLILTNGQEFCFAVTQLNTIAINLEVEGFVNKHTNLCCMEGPYRLYDEFDAASGTFKYKADDNANQDDEDDVSLKDGLNPYVVKRLLQMTLNR